MSEPFIAEIRMFAGNFAPNGWAFCDGQLMSINQNEALFSLIGTFYGGNGQSTFALPDLRGRVPMHAGQGPGLSPYVIGEKTGTENVTLITNQMPQHTHLVNADSTNGNAASPSGALWAEGPGGRGQIPLQYTTGAPSAPVTMNPGALQFSGANQPHPNLQPSLTVSFIIALVGIFPSRG